eukprot:gene31608-40698_t
MTISRRFVLGFGTAALTLPTFARADPGLVPEPRSPSGSVLGEGPLWSARDNTLYWVDIRGKKLHALSLDT